MFRLDKVLRWKERLEKEARAERFGLQRRADDLAAERRELEARRAAVPDEADAAELGEWSRWAEALRHRETHLEMRMEALRPRLQEAVRAHVALRREVEGLRRLRERALEEARRRRERKAQEAIDDAANRRRLPGTGMKFPAHAAARAAAAAGDHRPGTRAGSGQGLNPGMGA
jgi:flagellar biosynthesis chaperone FliJ